MVGKILVEAGVVISILFLFVVWPACMTASKADGNFEIQDG